jgi:hypothetical protein
MAKWERCAHTGENGAGEGNADVLHFCVSLAAHAPTFARISTTKKDESAPFLWDKKEIGLYRDSVIA